MIAPIDLSMVRVALAAVATGAGRWGAMAGGPRCHSRCGSRLPYVVTVSSTAAPLTPGHVPRVPRAERSVRRGEGGAP